MLPLADVRDQAYHDREVPHRGANLDGARPNQRKAGGPMSESTTHDSLCEWWQAQCEGYDCAPDPGELCKHFYCLCDLIAKVRADERGES